MIVGGKTTLYGILICPKCFNDELRTVDVGDVWFHYECKKCNHIFIK